MFFESKKQVTQLPWKCLVRPVFILVIFKIILFFSFQISAKTVNPGHPLIRYTGRFDFSIPQRVRFDWPGVTIEAAFEGSSCTVLLKGYGEAFNLFVDGEFYKILRTDSINQKYELVSGLKDTVHTVLITKRYLIENVICEFRGFVIDNGKKLHPIGKKRPGYRIEFVGASSLNGFGNESSCIKCESIFDSSNSYYSYGPLTARALDAECVVVAATGKGMVRNWGAPFVSSFYPFNSVFFRTLRNSEYPVWNHKKWVPHVIVVCLGTNDFSTHPYPDKNVFVYTYTAFVQQIMDLYPNVKVVCLSSDKEPVRSYVREIVEKMKESGINDIYSVAYDPVPYHNRGCDWHPNIKAHKKISQKLVTVIEPLLKDF